MYTKPFLYLALVLSIACIVPCLAQPGLAGNDEADPVADAIRALQNPDPEMREQAIFFLTFNRDERVLELLFAALSDNNMMVRRAAMHAWGGQLQLDIVPEAMRDRVLAKALEFMNDRNAELRAAAASTLGHVQQPAAVEALLAAVNDRSENVRAAVASSLWNEKRPTDTPPWPELRERALTALLMLLQDNKPDERNTAVESLRYIKDARVDAALLELLSSPDARMRREVVGSLTDKAYADRIAPLLQDPDANVREATIRVYANMGLPQDRRLVLLLPLLQDPVAGVRETTVEALNDCDDPRITEALLLLVRDKDESTARSAYFSLIQRPPHPDVLAFLLATRQEHTNDMAFYKALAHQKDPRAVQVLLDSLKDPDLNVREHAQNALEYMRYPGAIEQLLTATGDANALVRKTAVAAIENMFWMSDDGEILTAEDREKLLEPLLALAKHKDEAVSGIATNALREYQDLRVTQTYIELLQAGRGEVIERLNLRLTLKTAEPLIPYFVTQLANQQYEDEAGSMLRTLGEPGRKAVRALLTQPKMGLRMAAMRWLGVEQDAASFEAILAAAHETPAGVRKAAVIALGDYGDVRAQETLRACVKDQDIAVQREAVISLALCGGDADLAQLLDICTLEEDKIAYRAAHALWYVHDPASVPGIITLLQKDNNITRQMIELLGELRDARAVEPLIAMLHEDRNYTSNDVVVRALGKIGDRRALKPLIALLDESSDWYWAMPALVAFHDADVVEPMLLALQKVYNAQANGSIPDVVYQNDRTDLAEALCEIGTPALEKLIVLLSDERPEMRTMAALCLEEIADARTVPALIAALQDAQPPVRAQAARALAMVRDARALAPLQALLSTDKDAAVRVAAAYALGRLGDPRAVETLAAAMQGAEAEVRNEATLALALLGDSRAAKPLMALIKTTTAPTEAMFVALTRVKDGVDVAELFPLLDDEREGVMMWTATALESIKDPRALDPLLARLAKIPEGDYDLFYAIGVLNDPRGTAALLQMYHDGKHHFDIYYMCCGQKDPRFGALLLDELQKPHNLTETQNIVYALGEMHYAPAVDPLLALLQACNDEDLMSAVAYALAEIGETRAADPLFDALSKVRLHSTKSSIVYALGNFRDARGVAPGCALFTTDYLGTECGIQGLGLLGDAKAIPALLNAYKIAPEYGYDEMQVDVASALGQIKDPQAVEPLLDMLARMTPRSFDPCIFTRYYYPEEYALRIQVIRALGEIGDARAVEPLIAALQQGYLLDRLEAIAALGKLGDPRASGPITAIMEHLPLPTRDAATAALKTLEGR